MFGFDIVVILDLFGMPSGFVRDECDYSIGLIIFSIYAISSSVRLYFAYKSASVQGREKSCSGTNLNLSLERFIEDTAVNNINLTNFVANLFIYLFLL